MKQRTFQHPNRFISGLSLSIVAASLGPLCLTSCSGSHSPTPQQVADEDSHSADAPIRRKVDLASLQGVWDFTRISSGSEYRDLPAGSTITIVDSQMYILCNGKIEGLFNIVLKHDGNPANIDLQCPDGQLFVGIAELEGDNLRVCLTGLKERPQDFSGYGSPLVLRDEGSVTVRANPHQQWECKKAGTQFR